MLAASPALAAHRRQLPQNEDLVGSGSIIYTWHGNPARGCAAESLCGVHGALVIGHVEGANLSSHELFLGGGSTVRVVDRGGECVDSLGGPYSFGNALQVQRQGARWTASFQPPSALSGRCAEPLGQELAALSFPVKLSGRRSRPTLSLRLSRPFVAGPYSGSVDSTLVLRPAPPNGFGGGFVGSFTSGSGSSRSGISPPVIAEFVNLVYRASVVPSAIQYQLAGTTDPFCQMLDSCGTTGSISLSASGPALTLTLSAVRRVRHRVSRSRVLADFRRGKLPFSFPGFGQLQVAVRESLTEQDGSSCEDSSAGQLQLVLGAFNFPRPIPAGGVMPAVLTSSEPAEVLRTHCAGPLDQDIIGSSGGQPMYAAGRIPTGALLTRQFDVSLTRSGEFTSFGYSGTFDGALNFKFTRVSLHAGTEGAR
jgi:hypothetical protein